MTGGGKDLRRCLSLVVQESEWRRFSDTAAIGDDEYNPCVNRICKRNWVATLIIPDTNAANDSAVTEIICHAERYSPGGDQARYVNFWRGTETQNATNANIAGGRRIGGTSAGLAVLGEFSYGCLKDKEETTISGPRMCCQILTTISFLLFPRTTADNPEQVVRLVWLTLGIRGFFHVRPFWLDIFHRISTGERLDRKGNQSGNDGRTKTLNATYWGDQVS